MSYFVHTDLNNSLLDPRLVDLGSTLIHVGAYDTKGHVPQRWPKLIQDQRALDQANYSLNQYK